MPERWACPNCQRSFTRKSQRHACGTGDARDVVRDRPEAVVRVYEAIAAYARSLGEVEIVARDRYVLLRSTRIFTDLQIMTRAVRAAVHLPRKVDDPLFFKVVAGPRFVTHVAKLHGDEEWAALKKYVREAYDASLRA